MVTPRVMLPDASRGIRVLHRRGGWFQRYQVVRRIEHNKIRCRRPRLVPGHLIHNNVAFAVQRDINFLLLKRIVASRYHHPINLHKTFIPPTATTVSQVRHNCKYDFPPSVQGLTHYLYWYFDVGVNAAFGKVRAGLPSLHRR